MQKTYADRKDDLSVLFEIKNMIETRSVKTSLRDVRDPDEKITQLHGRVEEMNSKIDELRDIVTHVKSGSEGPKKIRMKKDIISALNQHKRLNPSELGKIVGLSRARSNEYLRELEEEKIVKGLVINKKKFYMLEDEMARKAFG